MSWLSGEQSVECRIAVSVVVPVFNEVGNLPELYAQLTKALDELQYELLFVDDGSTDGSYDVLAAIHAKDRRVKVVRLANNFGQHAALSAGIEQAKGRAIVSLDADLECNPCDIPKLLAKIDEGYDVVSGWRHGRKNYLLRRLASYLVNKSISMFTKVPLHDYSCPLKAITSDVAQELKYYGEMRRFLGALAVQLGRSVVEVKVSHQPRTVGKSRYSVLQLIGHYLDFMVGFPTRSFQIVVVVGGLLILIGLAGGAIYFPLRYLVNFPFTGGFQILVFLAVFFGIQFAILGLLGEFTARIYRVLQNRPFFVIREILE
jgi:glycosyltransferase involved in cell wall biosynthesis